MDCQMDDKKFAILIDSDNISAKYVSAIMDEMMNHGIATYRRIYGDWTSTQAKSWKNLLAENSITPIQQFSNTVGKNSTDSALIIDAMDILYTGNVDGFCIVSSDGDFTRLASRLRESGMQVIGMGEEKTPRSFRAACSQFTLLENLMDFDDEEENSAETAGVKDKEEFSVKTSFIKAASIKDEELSSTEVADVKGSGQKGTSAKKSEEISKEIIENAIISIITKNENKGKVTELGEIGSRLVNKYPDFDVRNYGYSFLSKFLEEIPSLELVKTKKHGTKIKIKENIESKEEITRYVKELVAAKKTKGMDIGEVGRKVHEKYNHFNIKDYGYSKFSKFLQDIPELELYEDASKRKRVRKRG